MKNDYSKFKGDTEVKFAGAFAYLPDSAIIFRQSG